VKLLDFGVAKLLGDEETGEELPLTRGGARAFTPEYASPEQIRGDALTTASDVYSLGVVLYELLAGRRPHAATRRSAAAIEREVLETDIARPSASVTAEAALQRGEPNAERLRRRLASELDGITLRALRREPDRRYRSVEALADDLRRYLEGLPVEAQRGSTGYRVGKFVQRYRVALAAGLLVTLSLVAGVVGTSLEARRARLAQTRAEHVASFLGELLASVQPETGGRDVPVSELLAAAAKRVPTELAEEPDAQAELESVIGESEQSLGRYDDAEPHLRAALRLHERIDGRHSLAWVQAENNYGELFLARGDYERADSLFRAALAMHRDVTSSPDTLLAIVLDNIGAVAHSLGRPAESERYRREVLRIRTAVSGPGNDYTAVSINNLAIACAEQNRWDEADSLHGVALAILKHNHPEPNTLVANAENAMATSLDFRGKTAAAESLYLDVIALRAKLLGREHPDYAYTVMNYAIMLANLGRFEEAERYTREVLALRGRTIPDSHPVVSTSLQTLGRCLDHLGRTAEAEHALQESYDLRRKQYGPAHWLVGSSMSILGEHYGFQHQFARGEALMQQADAVLLAATSAADPRRTANLRRLEALYRAWGRPDRASAIHAGLSPDPR